MASEDVITEPHSSLLNCEDGLLITYCLAEKRSTLLALEWTDGVNDE